MHANYNMRTIVNDVAIIRHSWVTYNNNIQNINLYSGSNLFVGSWAWAAGFGATSDYRHHLVRAHRRLPAQPPRRLRPRQLFRVLALGPHVNTTLLKSRICTNEQTLSKRNARRYLSLLLLRIDATEPDYLSRRFVSLSRRRNAIRLRGLD